MGIDLQALTRQMRASFFFFPFHCFKKMKQLTIVSFERVSPPPLSLWSWLSENSTWPLRHSCWGEGVWEEGTSFCCFLGCMSLTQGSAENRCFGRVMYLKQLDEWQSFQLRFYNTWISPFRLLGHVPSVLREIAPVPKEIKCQLE